MAKISTFLGLLLVLCISSISFAGQDGGYDITSALWAKAVLQVTGNPVTLVWKEVGTDITPSGDQVISGYFYADPSDFAFGSQYNPEVFVKIYIATNGWCNLAFNHVTVDDVIVSSSHNYNGTQDQSGSISLSNRLLEHEYTGVIPPAVHNVDAFGANPYDALSDSDAIQTCIDQAKSGDTVTFTSSIGSSRYQGYLIDKTIFLLATSAKRNLTFTSTDSSNHALLKATAELKGSLVRLFARSQIDDPGDIDGITISHLDIDGSRDLRICYGEDGIENGLDDNWGSWLPECTVPGDSWCRAGSLAIDGMLDWEDPNQDFHGNPSRWSTNILVDDVLVKNTECGSAIALAAANSTIQNSSIIDAGDHTHVEGCTPVDSDEPLGAWSDGITLTGPDHLITDNVITNASDVGIVFFGGHDTVITKNTIRCSPGNHGMFAGIAVHPWSFGNVSGVEISNNNVINEGDSSCGGIHSGIDIGPHMWGGGCVTQASSSAIGNPVSCVSEPEPPSGKLCPENDSCQEWAHVANGEFFTIQGNYVSGAHVNYLIEGLDLVGELIESDNSSGPPRLTDWVAAKEGCDGVQWDPTDRVAHHPTLSGWTDLRIHCER